MKTKINTRCIIVKCFYGINHMLVKDHYYLIRNDTFIMREIANSKKNGTIRTIQKSHSYNLITIVSHLAWWYPSYNYYC